MNTLDADKYRINIPNIIYLTKDQTPEERIKYLGRVAVATSVPIIIVCTYIGEVYGFSDELNALVDRLKLFYNISEILNVKK